MAEYTVILEKGEKGWGAYVPDIPGCIATGRTRQLTEKRIREAISLHVELLREHGDPVPEPTIESVRVRVA